MSLNTDTTLAVFTVNGVTVSDGSYVYLPYGLSDVSLVLQPTDPTATITDVSSTTITITNVGGTNFDLTGISLANNPSVLTVLVTAQDTVTQTLYTVSFLMQNNDTSLATFQINNTTVSNGASVSVAYGTTSVTLYAIPADASASITNVSGTNVVPIDGNTYSIQSLSTGNNTVSVTVTAQDPSITTTYTVYIYVYNNDTSLASFQINSTPVSDGSYVYLAYGTTDASLALQTTDPSATIVSVVGSGLTIGSIDGLTYSIQGLSTGNNAVIVTVGAQDTSITTNYTVYLYVYNNDTSLATFQVNGISVTDGSSITVSSTSSSVSYTIVPTDTNASYQVTGNTGLIAGQFNTMSVVVSPQDPSASSQTYQVNIYRLNGNTNLSTYQVNGQTVSDGSNVVVPNGTTDASFTFVTADPSASIVSVYGYDAYGTALNITSTDGIHFATTSLNIGQNIINVSVQPEDPDPTLRVTHTFYISVAFDITLSQVVLVSNGQTYPVSVGSTTHFRYIRDITVNATPTDASASILINNGSATLVPIQFGINTIAITVVARDGLSSQTYYVYVSMDAICFKRGTRIRCLVAGKDTYVPIEEMRKGMLVKTLASGYVPVEIIGKSTIRNPGNKERVKHRLYRCGTSEYPDLFEPLFITGCHSILVDRLSSSQKHKTEDMLGQLYVTDNKYRLMACLDDRAEPYAREGDFEIWHFALQHDDYYANYGVYANGLLVESSSKRMMYEYSGMEIV